MNIYLLHFKFNSNVRTLKLEFGMRRNPPSLPSRFSGWNRYQKSPNKISKSGHWGILRKLHFFTYFPKSAWFYSFQSPFLHCMPPKMPHKILHTCITHIHTHHTTLWPKRPELVPNATGWSNWMGNIHIMCSGPLMRVVDHVPVVHPNPNPTQLEEPFEGHILD